MTDVAAEVPGSEFQFGGLTFDVSLRDGGATLRVIGTANGNSTEMLRFDDFVDSPHFHAPSSDPQIPFDRALGDPMVWYVAQVRDHLGEWLERAGFSQVLPSVDLAAIAAHADELERAMQVCVPAGCTRVPGVGLQRVTAPA
jgi:hypothetical protein